MKKRICLTVDEDVVTGLKLVPRGVSISELINWVLKAMVEDVKPGGMKLQHVMTGSGWGQIPVVDPQDGSIIGIVTRTDLLKTLSPQALLPRRFFLVSRMESLLPSGQLTLLKVISQAAHANHFALYIVGGFVRDLWLDLPSLDFDLVVEGDAIQLAYELAKQYGGRVTSHSRFGTAKWLIEPIVFARQCGNTNELSLTELPSTLDLVSARMEFYAHPTALPTVERGSIKLDLHRRQQLLIYQLQVPEGVRHG